MSRHHAYIQKNWQEYGLASIAIWRARADGYGDFAFLLVDCWCLGVKHAFYQEDAPLSAWEETLHTQIPEGDRESIHPACAKKLIEGALAFAEHLGFSPHRDYRKARRVLSGLDATQCPTDFVFGNNGRPRFISGPDDDQTRIDRVLAILNARCGPDGYDYELFDHDADDGDDDGIDVETLRTTLRRFLHNEPEEVPRFYAVSGMIAAAHLAPEPCTPDALLATLWEPEGRDWEHPEDQHALAALFLLYWEYCGELLAECLPPDAPASARPLDVFETDFDALADEQAKGLGMVAAMMEWSTGFMRVTERRPEDWSEALARADLAPHWEVLRLWTDLPKGTGNFDRIKALSAATPPRTLGQSVIAIARALHRPPAS